MRRQFFTTLLIAGVVTISMFQETIIGKADVIWEPYDDNYYEQHRTECTYNGRVYFANGEQGQISVYNNPEQQKEELSLPNSYFMYIGFTYETRGIEWGICEYYYDLQEQKAVAYEDMDNTNWENYEHRDGWVKMEDLILKYDNQSFQEEYSDEIVQQSENLKLEYDWIYVWSYPGAKEFEQINLDVSTMPEISTSMIYVDEEGLTWKYFNYYMGYRKTWICVDKPQEENLLVREMKYENIVSPDIAANLNSTSSGQTDESETSLWQSFLDLRFEIKVIMGLVVAIIVATIILMKIMWNNREED